MYTFSDRDVDVTHDFVSVIDDTADFAALQRACPDLGRIFHYLEDGELPQDEKLARQTLAEADDFVIDDGILYHVHTPSRKQIDTIHPIIKQCVVPLSHRNEILHEYHDNSNHHSVDKMFATLRMKYYWTFMYRSVKTYVKLCKTCQAAKIGSAATAPLMSIAPQSGPLERWHSDILGPLPESNGCKYLLLCVDSFSRFIEAFPLPNIEAKTVADALYNEIFARYGLCIELLTDRGSNYMSEVMRHLCKSLNIKHLKSSAFHPQMNRMCESANAEILKSLRCFCTKQEDWAFHIPSILYGIRSSVNLSIGLSPFHVLFGREMRKPTDIHVDPAAQFRSATAREYAKQLHQRLQKINELVQANTREAQDVQKSQYDQGTRLRNFHVGDRVWLRNMMKYKGVCPKLFQKKWSGPYVIVACSGPLTYLLKEC